MRRFKQIYFTFYLLKEQTKKNLHGFTLRQGLINSLYIKKNPSFQTPHLIRIYKKFLYLELP